MSDEKIDKLQFVRIFTPVHIPKYLVEQIKDRDFDVDDFYKWQENHCTYLDKDGQMQVSPLNHLYVLVNDEFKVVGFLWFTVDDLNQTIFVNNFSMDKEYWFKGKAIDLAAKHVKKIQKNAKLRKVYWATNCPKVFSKMGFKQCKSVIMEYQPEVKDGKNTDGVIKASGECKQPAA